MVYQKAVLVWRRRAFFSSFLLFILVAMLRLPAFAGGVTLAWSPSTAANVASYNIYYGGAHADYTNKTSVINSTNVTITGLVAGGTYYFAATTVSAAGIESQFSAEVSYTI